MRKRYVRRALYLWAFLVLRGPVAFALPGNSPTDNSVSGCGANVKSTFPGERWDRVDPITAGWSSENLAKAARFAESIGSANFLIVERGRIIYSWGNIQTRYRVHSIRKSFLSALYGIHVAQGEIPLERTLEDLGVDDLSPSLSLPEKTARVWDLLTARSGVYHVASSETGSMRNRRPERSSHAPNTYWYYNNWDFNVLGTIFRQETGKDIFEAFRDEIAIPLQMRSFRVEECEYRYVPESKHPAYHFRMSSVDLARFGLLYLNKGGWRGKQIIPANWVADSLRPISMAGDRGAYGYLWWVEHNGKHFPHVELPSGSFSARGFGGHYIVVIPKYDLVIVHRADTDSNPAGIKDPSKQFGSLLNLILKARPK